MTDGLGSDHREAADDDDRAKYTRRWNSLAKKYGGEQKAAKRRAGRLDHAAVTKRDEQEANIADERHAGPAQDHQHQPPSPSDAAEIANAGAKHQRQERDARPQIAVHQQVGRRKSELQPMPSASAAE